MRGVLLLLLLVVVLTGCAGEGNLITGNTVQDTTIQEESTPQEPEEVQVTGGTVTRVDFGEDI